MSRIGRFAKRYGAAAAGAAYAFTLGLRDSRHRSLIQQIATHFGHDDHPERLLPRVSPASITSPLTDIALPEPEGIDGNVSLLELVVIARLVRERAPMELFEIGTFDGRTTLALAVNAPEGAKVVTLDLPAGSETELSLAPKERQYVEKTTSGARLRGHAAAAKVTQVYGDSAAFDFSPYSAQFVFVDASHAYEYVLSDSQRAIELLGEKGGVILWHDYGAWEGVTRALNELYARDVRFEGLRWIEGTTLVILGAREGTDRDVAGRA
jgi:predicted O-methyltransferase YrrM